MHRWLSSFAIALASALTFNACGGDGSSPTSPTRTPDPATHPASLSGTMTVNGAQTDGGEYRDTSEIRLTESGGTAATITGVTLSFLKDGDAYAATDTVGSEAWISNNNVIGANGTLTSKPLTVTDAHDRYADHVEARITYTDGTSGSNAITVRATVPALPAPPGNSKFTLTGTVKDASSGSTIRDAKIEVQDGASAGRNTKTDGSGRYSLADLNPGSFTVRASKTGYASSDLAVLNSNTTLNFTLRKSDSGGGGSGGDDGGGAAVPT